MDFRLKYGYRLSSCLIAFRRVSLLSDFLVSFLHTWQGACSLETLGGKVRRDLLGATNPSKQMHNASQGPYERARKALLTKSQVSDLEFIEQ